MNTITPFHFSGKKAVLILALLLSNAGFLRAQDIGKIEDSLIALHAKIDYWEQQGADGFDSLSYANDQLLAYLKLICTKYPATLKAEFSRVKKETAIQIASSDDNKFRIYSWDNGAGGTMRYYNALVECERMGGVFYVVINDAQHDTDRNGHLQNGSRYSEVFKFQTKTGMGMFPSNKTVYLTQSTDKAASNMWGDHLTAYALYDGVLIKDVNFFKTGDKYESEIYCGYDLTNEINRKYFGQVPCIKFSKDMKTLYVPLITKDDEITGKYRVYKFDGNLFVFDKNAK